VTFRKILFFFVSYYFLFGSKSCTPQKDYALVLYTKPNSLQCKILINELYTVMRNFNSPDIDFLKCDCDKNAITCMMRDVKGVPFFDFIKKNQFGYNATQIQGKFNAEELTEIVANLTGIKPEDRLNNLIHGDENTVLRHKLAGKCVLYGNVNSIYGSRLRYVANDFLNGDVIAVSDSNGLFSIYPEDDIPFSYLYYFDGVYRINMSLPVDIIIQTVRTVCFHMDVENNKNYIHSLINGTKDVRPSVFNDKNISDDMIKFAQKMSKLNYIDLVEKLRKMQSIVLESNLNENVSRRLTRRIHILYCIIRYVVKP
jgi:hypothetical protein